MRAYSRPVAVSLAVLILLGLAIVLWVSEEIPTDLPRTADRPASPPAGSAAPSPTVAPVAPLFAERILEHYADPAHSPEEDVQAIARTLENFALLVKGDNPLPLGANEEIAAALRG